MNDPATQPPAASPPAQAVHDGLENPQRLLALATLGLATAMAVLDGSIVNVALPIMAHELRVAPATSVWIVNAFQIAVTISLLPLSALGDTLGYRRVYWPGLALFTSPRSPARFRRASRRSWPRAPCRASARPGS